MNDRTTTRAASPIGTPTRPCRVLILEDNSTDAALAERELKKTGFMLTTRQVSTRPDFERELNGFQPDVILADYSLPSFDGLAALEVTRRAFPHLPFIILSGSIGEERAIESMKCGATDYVLKDRPARLSSAVIRSLNDARTHHALQKSVSQLEQVYRLLPIAVYTARISAAFETTWISESVERQVGFPPPAFTGDPGFWVSPLHPEDRHRVIGEFRRIDRTQPLSIEYRWQAADGAYRWLIDQAALAPAAAHEDAEIIGTRLDVTERKQLERQLFQAQKMEAVGRLASGVAHDFNNLLTVINGYAQLLLLRLPAGDPSRESIEEIRKAGDRAAGLTRQLLAFSRKQVLQPQAIDLNVVVSELEKMLHRLIGEDIQFSTSPAPDLGRAMADPGQIEQVIMNLAVNARDAMPRGGRLTIETSNQELDASYTQGVPGFSPGRYVLLVVSDTGQGMDDETKAHLFEPFYTTKAVGRGTGLGLSTVFGIVKQSGGHVVCYSELGRGTSFKVYLPRVDGAAAPAATAHPSATSLRGAETLLLVEDDDTVRALETDILRGYGYTVLEARGGRDALARIEGRKDPIHLLVTDLVMPGIGGQDLLGFLAPAHPGIKVLYQSGYTNAAMAGLDQLAAGTPFLQKPFTPESLARAVRQALDDGKPAGGERT